MSTGKRNRERGLEFQREVVALAREYGLDAHVRDTCCFHNERGDIEIAGLYFGCKRKKTLAQFLLPEKREVGVFCREDRGAPLVIIEARQLFKLLENLVSRL